MKITVQKKHAMGLTVTEVGHNLKISGGKSVSEGLANHFRGPPGEQADTIEVTADYDIVSYAGLNSRVYVVNEGAENITVTASGGNAQSLEPSRAVGLVKTAAGDWRFDAADMVAERASTASALDEVALGARPNLVRNAGSFLLPASGSAWSAFFQSNSSAFDDEGAFSFEGYNALAGYNGTTGPVDKGRRIHRSIDDGGENAAHDSIPSAFIAKIKSLTGTEFAANSPPWAVAEYTLGQGTAILNTSGFSLKFASNSRDFSIGSRVTCAAWIQPVGGAIEVRSRGENHRAYIDGSELPVGPYHRVEDGEIVHVCFLDSDRSQGYTWPIFPIYSDPNAANVKLNVAMLAVMAGAHQLNPEHHTHPIRSNFLVTQ